MLIPEIHVFELWIKTNFSVSDFLFSVYDPRSFFLYEIYLDESTASTGLLLTCITISSQFAR